MQNLGRHLRRLLKDSLGRFCARATDVCLALCLFAAPLWFGGRHDLGRFFYVGLATAAAAFWGLRCRLLGRLPRRPTAMHAIIGAAVALVVLQIIPLPPDLLKQLSPAMAGVAPAWVDSADFPVHLGQWQTLSLTPSATATGLCLFIGHALLFCVVMDRLQSLGDIRTLLVAIGIASAAMALFGLIQWLTSNGKLLWFYPHPQRAIGEAVQGSFANKNHFAHFVVLGIGPAIYAWRRRADQAVPRKASPQQAMQHRAKALLSAAGVVIAVVGVVLSLSRGGFAAMVVATLAGGVVLLAGRLIRPRHAGWAAGFAAAALLAVSLADYNAVADRLDDFAAGSVQELDRSGGRREVWRANLAALGANPWFGYGVGSHADIYHAYFAGGFGVEFSHAESGYLHTTTETGLAGGALLLAAIATVARWCWVGVRRETDPERLALWAAVVAGLAASVAHSVADFVWYIPACMSVTVFLVACAARLYQTAPQRVAPPEIDPAVASLALPALGVVAVLAVGGLWSPARASLAWDRYQRAARAERLLVAEQLRRPTMTEESATAAVALLKRQMIDSLEEVIARYPRHPRAHLRLAGRLLQDFELERQDAANSLGLMPIRDAAIASDFPSRAATLDWLGKAFGEKALRLNDAHHHALQGLVLAPLQADGYAYLANLTFLSPPAQRSVAGLMGQAMRARPNDGDVLFEAGRQALVAGDADRAVDLWKQAHTLPGVHRQLILLQLVGRTPAVDYLAEFTPGLSELYSAFELYAEKGYDEDLRAIAEYALKIGHEPHEGAAGRRDCCAAHLLAGRIALRRGEPSDAVKHARDACKWQPSDFAARRCLAVALVEANDHEEAQKHLRWCLARRPDDRGLRARLKQTHEQRRGHSQTVTTNRRQTPLR